MSSLAQMVIRLVAEARQYKADMSDAAQHTQKVAADIAQSTGQVQQAAAALGDQLGVQRDLSEKAGAAVAQMGAAHGLATVAVGGLAAGLVAYAVIAKQASDESKRQADALTLTGNAAGLVSGQLNQMARDAAAQVNGQVGNMRSTMETLVASGRVSQASLGEVAKGVELVARFSGQSREAVAKDFAGMSKDVSKWAADHNEQYHYLTLDQYKYIESLQKAGKVQEAMAANMDALAKAVGGDLTKNLGTLQKAWANVGSFASWAWDKMLNIGRENSGAEKLEQLAKELEYLQGKKYQNDTTRQRIEAIQQLMNTQRGEIELERRAADERQRIAEEEEKKIAKARDKTKSPKAGVDQQAKAYDALMESINAKVVAQEQELAIGKKLTEADKLYIQLDRLVAEGKIKAKDAYSAATIEMVENLRVLELASVAEKEAMKVAQDRQKLREKESDGIADWMAKQTAAAHASLAGIEGRVQGLKDEADAALLAQQLHVSMAQAVEMVAIAKLEEAKANKFVEGSEGWKAIEREIEARKELLGLIASKDVREATASALKASADEAKRANEDVVRSMTDQIMRGGKNAAQYLRDLFRTLVLRPLVQPVASAVTGMLGSLTGGLTGGGSAAGQIGSSWLTSSVGNALGLGSLFGSSTAYGAAIGTTSVGAGSQAAMLAAQTGEFGAAGLSATAGAAGGSMAAIGTAMPYIAAAVLAYSLLSKGGTKPSVEGGYSTAGNPGTNGRAYVNGYYGGAMDASAKTVVDGMTANYLATVKAAGGKAGDFTASQFTGIDQNGHASAIDMSAYVNGKAVYNRFADLGTNKVGSSDAEVKAALELASQKALIEALKATDMGPVLNAYLAGVTVQGKELAELTAVVADVTNVGAFQASLKGLPFEALTTMSVAATKALAEATGGFDALTNKLGSYLQNFYSDSERTAMTTQQVGAALSDLGMAMPTTRAGFRALVDAQDLTTESGRKNYAALMNVADAFASVTPSIDDVAAAAKQAADDIAAAAQRIASEHDSLQTQLWRAEGNKAALRAAELAKLDPSNRAMQQRIYDLEDEAAAADAARAAWESAADAARAAWESAAAAERTRMGELISGQQGVVSALQSVFDLLDQNVRDLYGQVDSTAAMSAQAANAFLHDALVQANAGGHLPEQQALAEAIAAARAGLAAGKYKSQFEEDQAKLALAGELAKLKAKTGEQLTVEQRSLRLQQDQLKALEGLKDVALQGVAATQDLAAALLGMYGAGSGGAGGGRGSGSGGAPSGAGYANGSGGSSWGGRGNGVKEDYSNTPSNINAWLGLIDWSEDDEHGGFMRSTSGLLRLRSIARTGGWTQADIARAISWPLEDVQAAYDAAGERSSPKWPESIRRFEGGGLHPGGWRIVGEREPELEFTGPARYFNGNQIRALMAPGAANDSMGGGAQLAALREDQRAQAAAVVMGLWDIRRFLRDWEINGLPTTREVAAA